jgi:RNA polymerase sigma-70 factor (ECF subfamily)
MVADEPLLLNRCRHGEPDAWDELFDRHYAATARFVYQLAADLTLEDAEEICQEVFLAVIRNLESFTGRCRFQTWVFQIAANKARDYRERRHAAKRGGGRTPISLDAEDPQTGLTIDPPAKAPTPPELLINEEKAGLVHEAMARLDAPCREVIELRYFGDLSYEEISSALAVNAKTVSSRLSKCLDRLETIVRRTFSREGEPLSRLTSE